METQELHRGRLIDHIQLVVRDLAASQAFYPKTGSYPVADSATGGVGGPMTGAMRSLM